MPRLAGRETGADKSDGARLKELAPEALIPMGLGQTPKISIGIGERAAVTFDVNGDGIADFELITRSCGAAFTCLDIDPLVTGDGIVGSDSLVAAGLSGTPVGPSDQFLTGDGNASMPIPAAPAATT